MKYLKYLGFSFLVLFAIAFGYVIWWNEVGLKEKTNSIPVTKSFEKIPSPANREAEIDALPISPTTSYQTATTTPSNSQYGSLPCTNRYATPSEILIALNSYRNAHGAGNLSWNEKLAEVARMRVSQTLEGGRDYHEGFRDFTSNQENFQKVGFSTLSENIGYACPLQAVHLIEQKIAKSPNHDQAQRDSSWISVGIATDQGVTSFIFGRNPL